MKKVVTVISMVLTMAAAFADTKVSVGYASFLMCSTVDEKCAGATMTSKTDSLYRNGYFAAVDSEYKYASFNGLCLADDEGFYRLSGDVKLKYDALYIGANGRYASNEEFLDIVAGAQYTHEVSSWLKVGGMAEVGYSLCDHMCVFGLHSIFLDNYVPQDISGSLITKIGFSASAFDCIDFYASMESSQKPNGSITNWLPYQVNNEIGVNVHYYFHNVGVYGRYYHNCKHPENANGLNPTSDNTGATYFTVGMTVRF